MECEDYPENGATVDVRCRGVKRRLCGVRLAAAASPAAPRPARRAAGLPPAATATGPPTPHRPAHNPLRARDLPFMNEMDEITYWIYTKRAPCLMSYDELAKKRAAPALLQTQAQAQAQAQAQTQAPAQHRPSVTHSISDQTDTPTPKKKKRKLSLLDDESDSGKGHENVYFDSSQRPPNQQTIISSSKSSDVDFNIKKSSIQEKTKRCQKKNNNLTLHKKNKIVSSTPKGTANLRRSLRNSRRSFNDSHVLNSSYELINVSLVNGAKNKFAPTCEQVKEKTPIDNLASCDQKTERNISSTMCTQQVKTKPNANGKFEDLSDVSGFTANYIRSTKIHSTKNGKKGKSNRSLLKESRQSLQKEPSKTVGCINKSVNTGLQNTTLNYSTDSSPNRLNLVTTEQNGPAKMSRSTSLLKFMDSKQIKNRSSKVPNLDVTGGSSKLDTSQSPSNGTPRYPRRCRISAQHVTVAACQEIDKHDRSQNSKKRNKIGPAESPGTPMTRARSGRPRTLRQSHTVLVLSASSEQLSSAVTMNVASPTANTSTPKNKALRKSRNKQESTIKSKRRKKSMNKSEHSGGRESLRDKKGFTACLLDSDCDDKPLKPHKFFC